MNRQTGGAQQIRKIGLQLRRRTGIEANAFFTGRASAHEGANLDGCTLGENRTQLRWEKRKKLLVT